MLTKPIYNANSGAGSSLFDRTSLGIAVALSILFAAAIIGALSPHPLADPLVASIQGGL